MSLSSSLYTGTSGLNNMSQALQVTSNNISNTNTLGFKKGYATFADTLYQAIGTQAGSAQVGLGMSVGNVSQNFSDGSLTPTGNATDMAIGGDGFFVVSQPGTEEVRYTRAGNFSFNENGALTNPQGYVLRGWDIDPETGDDIGAVKDLELKRFSSPPKKSEVMIFLAQLNSLEDANSSVLSNGYKYEAGKSTSVSPDNYDHQGVVTVYDSLGSPHELTIYCAKKSDSEWEYLIVCPPEEDKRSLVGNTSSQGILARGTIEFSESSGKIVNMTMEEFSGRVGGVKTIGANTVDDINFEIQDSEAMLVDGYGIEMSFDGNKWVLDTASLPKAYPNAKIIYSDDQNIYLMLDPDSSGKAEEADIKIKLDQLAMSGDTIRFDINDTDALHIQDLAEIAYGGSAKNKTEYTVNAPNVMTRDAQGLGIAWNPVTETWQWSNAKTAADAGTLVRGLATNSSATVSTDPANIKINNAEDMTVTIEDLNLIFNGTGWDWNEPLKEKDIVNAANTFDNPDNKMTLEVITAGEEGAMATASDIELEWNGTAWSVNNAGGLTVNILPGSDASHVQVEIYDTNAGQSSTIQYTFDEPMTATAGQTLSFGIKPSPPAEYANAQIVATADNSVAIDFNGNGSTDLTIDVTAGGTVTPAAGNTLSFTVDPDLPPAEYADAVLSGDKTKAVIDLDGSGGEDDKEDIVFSFSENLKTGADTPREDWATINFNIQGSSAWRECSTDEAKDSGYYKLTTDFLGGEFGSTETDISLNIGTKWDGNNWVNDSTTTTQYGKKSSTRYQDSDGYPPGDLTGVDVTADGQVIGTYSNGQQIPLFRVALVDFNNPNGLVNKGGNLYAATRKSGAAITNKPGDNGGGRTDLLQP